MNSCAEVRESIGAWLDGELTGAGADAIPSHLEMCAACAEERRQLANLDSAMKAIFEAEASRRETQPFWDELRQRIEAKQPWYARVVAWAGPEFRTPSFAWAVPSVIVLLIAALYFDLLSYSWSLGAPSNNFATVESIDAYGRNVALLREHESKTTVIWIYQNPDTEGEASGEVVDKGPAF
jgi:hypothetical protein